MNDQKIEKDFEVYTELAKQDKSIDVAGLMINALNTPSVNFVPNRQKHLAYLISLGIPPLGLIYIAKFYLSNYEDRKAVMWVCFGLTVFSILSFFFLSNMLFSSSGVDMEQLQQITPQDMQGLTQ